MHFFLPLNRVMPAAFSLYDKLSERSRMVLIFSLHSVHTVNKLLSQCQTIAVRLSAIACKTSY